MWNIRMRALTKAGGRYHMSGVRQQQREIHISGAEGIHKESEIKKICCGYIKRALNHSRGRPDKIIITIEEIRQGSETVPLLPVTTLKCSSPEEAEKIIIQRLTELDISKNARNNGFRVLRSKKIMHGAALIFMKSGKRAEPDKKRGVRASRLGIKKAAGKRLAQRLSRMKINTASLMRVKEALVLASKVASCPEIIAEVCISDDPDYTTGYIAAKKFGYIRIPNIKNCDEMHGGRIFFIKEGANIDKLVNYLEKKPVILYGDYKSFGTV